MFCFHKYNSVLPVTDYQYCLKCGKATPVPCNHKWEVYNTFNVCDENEDLTGIVYIQKCTKCGKLIRIRIKARA